MMTKEKRTLTSLIQTLKNYFALFSILTLIFLTGCNKTEDFEDLDLLTNKNWQIISRIQDGIDITNDCDMDDILIFEDAKNFNYNIGLLNCPENEVTKVANSWKIVDDFTVLRLKYKFSGSGSGSMVEYWEIVELNETTLIIGDASAEDNDQIPEIRTYQN